MFFFDTLKALVSNAVVCRLIIQTGLVINFVVVCSYYSLLQISYRQILVKSEAKFEYVVVKA